MKVVRERPCQRRYHRVTAPLSVVLPDQQEVMATNWSLGGLRLDGIVGILPKPDDVLKLTLRLPFQGFQIAFDVEARVVRALDAEAMIGCEFLELSERAYDLLNHFIDDLVRGSMATIEDTICRIDVPVTPISTKPDPNPSGETPIDRLAWKTIFMTALYGIAGVMAFGYIGFLLYTNTMRMEIRSAVVSAPLATLKMPVDGILRPVRFELGQRVSRGQVIARIENPNFLSDMEDKKIALKEAMRKQKLAQEKYRIETSRMKLYQVISRTDRQIAKARVVSAEEALGAADSSYARLAGLFKKNLVAATKLEVATKERAMAESRLKEAQFELEQSTAMDSVAGRRYFNHKEFVADLDMFALEIERANSDVKTAQDQLEKLELLRTAMSIIAPYDGRIVSIQQAGHTSVLRNEPLLTIEQQIDPTVTAFLNQDQVLNVGLNDTAKVFLPALGKHIKATVVMVDRNSTFINSNRSHYSWKDGKEKSAAVSLRLDLAGIERSDVSAGLPAVVVFSKRQVNDIYHRISSLVSSDSLKVSDDPSI